jgi:hypothetical protein
MLRHKAMVQCARICFGLSGIYEPDEASRIDAAHKSSGNSSNKVQLIKKQNSQHSTTSFVKNWIYEGSRDKSLQNITNTVT